jgi:hypothetical protein
VEALLTDLEAAGVARDDLYLAWDFTVASSEGLTGDALAMRDAAFATLSADGAPPFTVTEVTRAPGYPRGRAAWCREPSRSRAT